MKYEQKKTIIADALAEELQALPLLSEFFPHQFENRTRIDRLSMVCAQCENDIPSDNIHANVAVYEHSVAVEAYAVCFECRLITPSKMRFSDDGGLLAADAAGNWHKRRFCAEKSGWLSRLKAMFSSNG